MCDSCPQKNEQIVATRHKCRQAIRPSYIMQEIGHQTAGTIVRNLLKRPGVDRHINAPEITGVKNISNCDKTLHAALNENHGSDFKYLT